MKKALTSLWVDTTFRSSEAEGRFKLIKLAVVFVSALLAGVFVARMLKQVALFSGNPVRVTFMITALASYIMTLLILGTLRDQARVHTMHRAQNLLSVLPLTRADLWYFTVIPSIFIGSLQAVFGLPIVVSLSQAANMPLSIGIFALVVSLFSAFGLSHYPRLQTHQFILILVVLSVSFSRVVSLMADQSLMRQYVGWIVLICLFLLGLCGFNQSFKRIYERSKPTSYRVKRLALGAWWFRAKLERNAPIRQAAFISLGLSTVFAAILTVRNIGGTSVYAWLIFCSLLSLSYAVEVRGTSRRNRTPEIAAIRDVGHFVLRQWTTSFLATLLLGLPVLMAILHATGEPIYAVIYISFQLFAHTSGLLVGTIFVPKAGDTGILFVSTCTATALFFATLKFSGLTTYPINGQIVGRLALSVVGLLIIYIIEYRRRISYA